MLTGLTLDYYYLNTDINTTAIFDKMCKSIQTYFEEAKYKRNVLSKQNITTLKSIIRKIRESQQKNTFSFSLKTFVTCNMNQMSNSALISLYTTNLFICVKIFLLVNTHTSNPQTPWPVLLIIYALLSLSFKKQTWILCRHKLFLPIGAITNSTKLHYQLILKEIIETIEKIIQFG